MNWVRLYCFGALIVSTVVSNAPAAKLNLRFAGGENEVTLSYGQTAILEIAWVMGATDTTKSGVKVSGINLRFNVDDALGEPAGDLFVQEITTLPGWQLASTNGVPFTENDCFLGANDPTGTGIPGNGTVFETVLATLVIRNDAEAAADVMVTTRHSSPSDLLPAAENGVSYWNLRWQEAVSAAGQFGLGLGNPGDADAIWDPYHGLETFEPLTVHLIGGDAPHPPPPCTLPPIPGDSDADGDLDLADFAEFQACRNGPLATSAPPGCEAFFANPDDDVDQFDYAAFQASITGPGSPSEPEAPAPGSPRSWEAGMDVGTNTSVTLRSGNMLTTIPIVSWSGRGPGMNIALYHNSGGVGMDATLGAGFNLGPGWTVSYGGHIVPAGPAPPGTGSTATVVDDDGTRTLFTWNGTAYQAPAGVYETLAYVGGSPVVWRVTYKDQTKREYDSAGRLKYEWDASGNRLQVLRDAQGRIQAIEDAPGRRVNFVPDALGRLEKFVDPQINRAWTLVYDPSTGRVSEIRDPLYNPQLSLTKHRWGFGYDADGRISSLSDKDNNAFTYGYSCGRLVTVNDPGLLNQQVQRFAYASATLPGTTGVSQATVYTDRRGHLWRYVFDAADNRVRFTDPLGATTRWARDAAHEIDRYTDTMGHFWDFVHDAHGNLLDVTDQYGRASQRQYDALNNLTSFTDEAGNEITLQYDDPENPTSPAGIIEPATPESGSGSVPAITTTDYFDKFDQPPGMSVGAWNGLVNTVTDPNGATTRLEHDANGYSSRYIEGSETSPGTGAPLSAVTLNLDYNAVGWLLDSWFTGQRGIPCFFTNSYDDNGYQIGICCGGFRSGGFRPDGSWSIERDGMSRPLTQTGSVRYDPVNPDTAKSRIMTMLYEDPLGRMTSRSLSTEEWGVGVPPRVFEYFYDDVAATYAVSGPDGESTVGTYDPVGRPSSRTQGDAWAQYTYYPDGRPHFVFRGNGTTTEYTYDFEDLRTTIEHRAANDETLLRLDYQFTTNQLIESITESNASGWLATTIFAHDARRRLYDEARVGYSPYAFSYAYDLGGNRKTKTGWITSSANASVTTHIYDLDDPELHGSMANRLVSYATELVSNGELIEAGAYDYNEEGNPWTLTQDIYDQGQLDRTQTIFFDYDKPGRLWRLRITESVPGGSETPTLAREFRYDAPRQRYLVRELDPNTLQPIPGGDLWSDYDGDWIYADYTVAGATVIPSRRYFAGEWQTQASTNSTDFFHSDWIGTTRLMTGSSGQAPATASRVFTAFGEPVSASGAANTRYGYAGSWGYQENTSLPLLHVGARYYDPALGRFLQRDPIGIANGLNVYAYVDGSPTVSVDPSGLGIIGVAKSVIKGIQKWAEEKMGKNSPAKAARGPIEVTARAIECAPDIARLKIVADFRRDSLLNPDLDWDQAFDAYNKGHKGHVKPGRGPRD